jgi:hypothetical protein
MPSFFEGQLTKPRLAAPWPNDRGKVWAQQDHHVALQRVSALVDTVT